MEGDSLPALSLTRLGISIHSLRMEGDCWSCHAFLPLPHFNPLPPHGGRRNVLRKKGKRPKFQSTPSAWRETQTLPSLRRRWSNFNPLPPHGGRPFVHGTVIAVSGISIHSLRMEGDWSLPGCPEKSRYFNPLPPHGGRLSKTGTMTFCRRFQSTPSAWRETIMRCFPSSTGRFQSTPSAWRETPIACQFNNLQNISIHSLRMEGDSWSASRSPTWIISIHSLRMEGDLCRPHSR